MNEYTIVKAYKTNDELRKSFNNLAEETYGLNFENWYKNSYWKENYNPYSIVCNNKIVANVSVNTITFDYDGDYIKLIQLGTVMTSCEHRNKGLIRKLINEIEKDYNGKVDGYYLFANDSVLDFYPKFHYSKANEYEYVKKINDNKDIAVKVPMNNKEEWDKIYKIINESASNSRFAMKNNAELYMFYLSQFMQENVYYIKENDSYAIAEIEDNKLILQDYFSKKEVNIDEIINCFKNVNEVVLGFTPKCADDFDIIKHKEEDTTLFVKGEFFNKYNKDKLIFQPLSHA